MNRRELMQTGIMAATSFGLRSADAKVAAPVAGEVAPPSRRSDISTTLLSAWVGCGPECLWQFCLHGSNIVHKLTPPTFPLDGGSVRAAVKNMQMVGTAVTLRNGVKEIRYRGSVLGNDGLQLELLLEVNDRTPIIRFRYELFSSTPRAMGRSSKHDELTYFGVSLAHLPTRKELCLSRYEGLSHSYRLSEEEIPESSFLDCLSVMGPLIAATDGRDSFLLAYEHGSQSPDAYLQFSLFPDARAVVSAVKGNYLSGQLIDNAHSFKSIWFETGAVKGDLDSLASVYRSFVLRDMSQNAESRKPYVFYNTWNFQERNKWWNNKPYLESINLDRIMKEIDSAHWMGIDIFVIDTGWYDKTGDWRVSQKAFPDGLRTVKAKLDGYGMKLGLWIGPTTAAVSSRIVKEHPEWRSSWSSSVYAAEPIWETEESFHMCMVSDYSDALAGELIRIAQDIGVTYFKWDWDGLPGCPCNDPAHLHGDATHSAEERFDSYRFQLIQRMCRTAERVAAAVPGVIIEFDITEEGRQMGLGFLTVGKYFQLNNGPYYFNYDVPIDKDRTNWNLFFYQGQARAWIMRTQLVVDKWLPSILFLTHYFPDDPLQWQELNIASLILGHNGIWGDLPDVSSGGIEYFGTVLRRSKEGAEDITNSSPVRSGFVSGSPEVHEKISKTSGRGAVALFATVAGKYSYITANVVASHYWASDGVDVTIYEDRGARINATFDKPGAKIVFFGCT